MPEGPTEWMEWAACRDTDKSMFFPKVGEDSGAALAICAECIVRNDCLAVAMSNSKILGIWGGTTAKRRETLRQQRGPGGVRGRE